MTVASIRLPSTIAAIVLLIIVVLVPLILYLRIILNFLCNSRLQKELVGKGDDEPKDGKDVVVISKPPQVLLSFQDVTYTVIKSKKQILKGVTGYFAPRTLTAILGTSGCGKTTLLTVLADQMETTGETTGDVCVNGKERTTNFRRLCAYVMQSDHLLESLTVRETLWFTAELRLGNFSTAEKLSIVKKTLKDLDLAPAADRMVSVLSGGQKRRVTVAIELVAMPSLIFLDEPTSGLDASGSLKLVRVLRKLADDGRTIVCTIHQPRVDAFNLFHMVLLMNEGSLLYFGPQTKIVEYFSGLGRKQSLAKIGTHQSIRNLLEQEDDDAQEAMNPADFVLDFTHGKSDDVKQYCDEFQQSQQYQSLVAMVSKLHKQGFKSGEYFGPVPREDLAWFPELHVFPSSDDDDAMLLLSRQTSLESRQGQANRCCSCRLVTKYASTNMKQVFTLTRRAFVSSMRNGAYLMSWVLGIVMMLFMGMLYCYVKTPPFTPGQFRVIEQDLVDWGACSQNLTVLSATLNQTAAQVQATLWQCGTDLNDSILLGQARTSLLYQLLASMFFSEMPLVANIHQDRNLYVREHASRSYSSLAWVLSWICRIAFSGMVKGLVFPPFVYFSAQLPIAFEAYILFSIFMGIMSVMGASMALLVSVVFQSFETASVAFVVVNIVCQNLSGYFIIEEYIPWYFRWIYFINFFRYTFQGTVISQRLTPANLAAATEVGNTEAFQNVQEAAWLYALVAVIFCIGIQIISALIVQFTGSKYTAPCSRGLASSTKQHQQEALVFTPLQMGGAFTLTTFGRGQMNPNLAAHAGNGPETPPPPPQGPQE